MDYSNSKLLEALAQRYVIGTMSYRARRRFGQILESNEQARALVMDWEERLSPLVMRLDPVQPSELLWPRIIRELNATAASNSAAKPLPVQFSKNSFAAMAVLVISVTITSFGWWQSASHPQQPEIVSIPEAAAISLLADADTTLWVARIYTQSARLEIDVATRPQIQSDKDYELWALQENGVPVSLGLLPKSGRLSSQLSTDALAALSRSSTLAVSLEPTGGSPLLTPSGPVLYTAQIFSASG